MGTTVVAEFARIQDRSPADILRIQTDARPRSQPLEDGDCMTETAKQLGLESTLRSRGRPRKTAS